MSDDLVIADLIKDKARGLVVAPMLRTYLANAEFPEEFSISFTKGTHRRDSDGWFWPSTHPTWPERMLWLYLNDPEALPEDYRLHMNTFALTMGSAVHGFIETCLMHMNLRQPELNLCQSCPPEKGCKEPGFADPEVGSRGHMDGILDVSSLKPLPSGVPDVVGWELKTASERVINGIEDMDLAAYRQKKPEYYGQKQEYMRLSGLSMVIVNFIQLGWPWTIREVHVPFDEGYARTVEAKYRDVRAAQEMPECCGRKACPQWAWCQVDSAQKGPQYLLAAPPGRRT